MIIMHSANKTSTYSLFIKVNLIMAGGILFSMLACHSRTRDDQKKILDDYAKADCILLQIINEKDSTLNSYIKPLEQQLSQLNHEFRSSSSVYTEKLDRLNKLKYEAALNADEESARISKEHELQFGHNITREYERKMNAVENKKRQQLATYDQQINALTKRMESDKNLQERKNQIEQIKNKTVSVKRDIESQFETKINDAKNELNEISKWLNTVREELSGTEKNNFLKQMEKIKINPCRLLP